MDHKGPLDRLDHKVIKETLDRLVLLGHKDQRVNLVNRAVLELLVREGRQDFLVQWDSKVNQGHKDSKVKLVRLELQGHLVLQDQ